MKNRINTLLRGRAAPIAALLLAAAIIGGTAAAQFTLSHRARRVIAAYDAAEMLFSSNYMQEQRVQRSYYTDSESGSVTVDVTVCNYVQGNHFVFRDQAFSYSLEARVVRVENGSATDLTGSASAGVPTIEFDGDAAHPLAENGSYTAYTFSGMEMDPEAEGRGDITHIYHLTFPETFRDDPGMYIQLIATPSVSDLKPISVWMNFKKSAAAAVREWTLVAQDNTSNPIGDYSGFNYQLRGSGAGTVTLSWDSSLLEISEIFLESVGAPAPVTSNGFTSIEIAVDSFVKNSYDIQFYRRAGGTISAWSDIAVDAAVSCSFAEADTGG